MQQEFQILKCCQQPIMIQRSSNRIKKFNISLILVLSINLINAQNPLVKQWDFRFGGTDSEQLSSFQQTNDGGYILSGFSKSGISGDKTQTSWGLTDYWIVKIDTLGIKKWDKDFGGSNADNLYTLQQTIDGGYILGGYSYSDSSGNKTQNNWDPTLATPDYWIVKIDSIGNKQWDRTYGGTGIDMLLSIKQTKDNGYILGGQSMSKSSGDKTQGNWSNYFDYWIVKVDSLGIKQWDKRYGGIGIDQFSSLDLTCDGGYILGGTSNSGISGDRTQNNWDTTLFSSDYWIVKINSIGIKQWDKRFGGKSGDELNSLQQTSDGGFILGGRSGSGIGGDKTEPIWGGADFWIVKIDSLGNKEWDKDFGGTKSESEFGNITQTCDGGYLIPGTSYSDSSGNKSENNLGQEQTWVIKVDSLGNKQWDKTLLTDILGDDESGFAIQNSAGYYLMANSTYGGIGGDKTQPCWSIYPDYWILKFQDTTFVPCSPTSPCNSIVGMNANIFIPELTVFPNPFSFDISISLRKQNLKQVSFIIRNILGQTILNKNEYKIGSNYTQTIDLGFLSKGIYLLDIIIDGERTMKKIVKQ